MNLLNLTTYPMAPITTKPTPTACVILTNSRLSANMGMLVSPQWNMLSWVREVEDLRFVHRLINCVPSRRKSLGISAISFSWSDIWNMDAVS